MKIRFKITAALLATVRIDLRRPHPFAHERVGFISAGLSAAGDDVLILPRSYRPVLDQDSKSSAGWHPAADSIWRLSHREEPRLAPFAGV